jgi:hypothetical protein
MSLYNMLFGMNEASDAILATLGLTKSDCGRFRNCWIEKINDKYRIVVYTRNGGGNREHYNDETIEGEDCGCTGCIIQYALPKNPLYLGDEDDDYDCTYASIYFSLPEDYKNELIAIACDEPIEPSEMWKKLLDQLKEATHES